ncbi:MAG: RNA polymerase sigma factor [Cytophagaceae bacterium]|nr:RNA polymerase sigma factor [Gemmatimonadaceae bacterium]
MLLAFALRLQGDADEASEVVQDAWLRALRGLGGFAWKSALRTWLLGVVLNCCRERWAARGESLEVVPELLPAPADHPDLRVDLERAIAALPTGYRAVVVLHDVEGYTHEEIAAQLGVAPGTSKSQLARARRHLRARLAPTAEG